MGHVVVAWLQHGTTFYDDFLPFLPAVLFSIEGFIFWVALVVVLRGANIEVVLVG